MSILLLILGLLLFIGLVVIHEFGHFIMARRGGVEVEEFGIGFPTSAKVLTKKNGTVYTLNWLPLGGFVKLKGENDADNTPGSFGAASLSTKVKIMLAGVVMNLLTAFALLTFLALVGMPKLIENQFTVASDAREVKREVLIGLVEDGSPAANAGLQERDRIISIGTSEQPQVIKSADNLPNVTKQFAGQKVSVAYSRDGQIQQTNVTLKSNQEVEASKKN